MLNEWSFIAVCVLGTLFVSHFKKRSKTEAQDDQSLQNTSNKRYLFSYPSSKYIGVVTGKDAEKFLESINNPKFVSEEEKQRLAENYEMFKQKLENNKMKTLIYTIPIEEDETEIVQVLIDKLNKLSYVSCSLKEGTYNVLDIVITESATDNVILSLGAFIGIVLANYHQTH